MINLLVIAHSSSLTGGGEEDFLRLIKYLHGKYNLIGVFPEGKKTDEYKKYVSDHVIIPNKMFPFTAFGIKSYAGYFLKARKKNSILKTYLEGKKIDLAYVHSSVCLYEVIILNSLKIPYILATREFINPPEVRRKFYGYFLKTSRKIIVISKILKEEYKKNNLFPEKIVTIYPGIEKSELPETQKSKEPVFLNIGNIFPDKGQDKVIKAFGDLKSQGKKFLLKIIGANVDDKYYQLLKSLVKKLDLENNVVFTGELSKENVLNEIKKTYAVIISSSFEGFSLVALEALSNKLPVISTPVGVIPEIITDGINGLIYEYPDHKKLSEKIDLLLNDEKLYSKLSENGFKTYENNFELSESLMKIEEQIRSALI